jgi:Pyruvate/2-oxoacid:ferredoxin oxidoreductase gamma subunit
MVMLGAMLEATGLVDSEWVASALARLVKAERWLDLNRRAIEYGRELIHREVSK